MFSMKDNDEHYFVALIAKDRVGYLISLQPCYSSQRETW